MLPVKLIIFELGLSETLVPSDRAPPFELPPILALPPPVVRSNLLGRRRTTAVMRGAKQWK